MADSDRVSSIDARLSALAVALEGPLALARVLGLSLDDVQSLVAIGYFREYQQRGHSLRMMTRRVQKSLRTVAALSSRARKEGPPLEGSQRVGLRRRVVRTLAVDGSATRDELASRLPKIGEDDLGEAIADLCEQAIVTEHDGTLALSAEHLDLARSDLDHRLESLRHFLGAVHSVIYQRFFAAHAESEAFARVFTFSVRPERLREIRARFYGELREAVLEADAEAEDAENDVQASVAMTFVETPTDPRWR